MAVLLDTRILPAAARSEAFAAAFNQASKPARVRVTTDVVAVLQAWPLGEAVTVVRLDMAVTELQVDRLPHHVRAADPERLSVALSLAGSCRTTHHGRQESDNRHLRMTDLTATYSVVQRGRCHAVALEVDQVRLGLGVDQIRQALPEVAHSPLHDLVRRTLGEIAAVSDDVGPGPRAELADAAVALIRGLLRSVSPIERDRRAAAADTLPLRIEDYVRHNLGDPDLTPSRIAAAHHISLRQLYVVLSGREATPAEWIMSLRLEAAARDLRTQAGTITQVAHRWGFVDHAHFTRRFKARYGITPRDYAGRTDRTAL